MSKSKYPKKFGFRSIMANCLKSDIKEVEDSLQCELPIEYVDFLREWNGGLFTEIPEHENELLVDAAGILDAEEGFLPACLFFGVGPCQIGLHLLSAIGDYRFNERVPANYLPVASGLSFKRFCICIDGDKKGQVFHWDPVFPGEEKYEVTTDYLSKIADTFPEF